MAWRALFTDRADAGRQLAQMLLALDLPDPMVLALPRGGVPVALEIARCLNAPLDLLLVRKIGAPGNREFAIGAIVDGVPPQRVIDREAVDYARASAAYIEAEIDRQVGVIARRRQLYLSGRPPLDPCGHDIIVVDDGIATGSTIRAALAGLRDRRPASVTIAAPVGPRDVIEMLGRDVERVVCLATPRPFNSVGEHYSDFHQLTDEEVIALSAHSPRPAREAPTRSS